MSININTNSPFSVEKDKLAAYGNKDMKADGKVEMVKAGLDAEQSVLVSISGDGVAALVKNKYMEGSGNVYETEEQKAERARKNELFEKEIKTFNLRQIIPNIQTNAALVNSLEGLDEKVVDTVYGIISDNLLKRDIGDMTEEERQNLISLGMEQVNYIAENYISEEKKEDFISVMETISKYGMNGTTDNEGKVTFDIKKGPMVGMPDDYDIDTDEILKEKAPEIYKEINEILVERGKIENEGRYTDIGKRMIELMKEARSVLNSSGAVQQNKEDYKIWKEKTQETELVKNFKESNYQDEKTFTDSIFRQNTISSFFHHNFLENNMTEFWNRLGVATEH